MLQCFCRHECRKAAQLVSRPPAHDCHRCACRHRCAFIGTHLLNPKRVNGDVLGGRSNRDDEGDSNDSLKVGHRINDAPESETDQDHHLQRHDPCAPVSQSCRQERYLYPVNQGRPEEIDRVNPEDQPGPADGCTAEAVLLKPKR